MSRGDCPEEWLEGVLIVGCGCPISFIVGPKILVAEFIGALC